MKQRGGGSIVFINSMIVREVLPTMASYAASKGALLAATQGLARELGPHKIRVNSVLPGYIWGATLEGYFKAQAAAARRRARGRLRRGRGEDRARRDPHLGGDRRRGALLRLRPLARRHRPVTRREWRPGDGVAALEVSWLTREATVRRDRRRRAERARAGRPRRAGHGPHDRAARRGGAPARARHRARAARARRRRGRSWLGAPAWSCAPADSRCTARSRAEAGSASSTAARSSACRWCRSCAATCAPGPPHPGSRSPRTSSSARFRASGGHPSVFAAWLDAHRFTRAAEALDDARARRFAGAVRAHRSRARAPRAREALGLARAARALDGRRDAPRDGRHQGRARPLVDRRPRLAHARRERRDRRELRPLSAPHPRLGRARGRCRGRRRGARTARRREAPGATPTWNARRRSRSLSGARARARRAPTCRR